MMKTPLHPLAVLLCLLCPVVPGVLASAPIDLTDPGPWLAFDFSLGWGMGPPGGEKPGGVRFEVQALEGSTLHRLFRANYLRRQWFPCAINLKRFAGKEVRFRFLVEHIEGRIMLDYPHWGNPRIVFGPLAGGSRPTEVFNFAMTPMDRAAALLPGGREVNLEEPDPIFHQGLVTPGRLSRDLMLLVYAGDNYICVPGKRQPGIYTGVSMSVDYLRIGAGPDAKPWSGQMPPPVFAEWKVQIPSVPVTTAPTITAPWAEPIRAKRSATTFTILQHRLDVHKYEPGLVARFDPKRVTMEVGMGRKTEVGWAFVGVEAVSPDKVQLTVERTGKHARRSDNSFGGLLVDFHTPRGYEDRVWLGLGAFSSDRYDLRPADWILDGPPLSLVRTMGFRSTYIDLSRQVLQGRANLRLDLARHAPPDWDGRVWLATGVQDLPPGAGLRVRLASPVSRQPATLTAPSVASVEDAEVRFVISGRNAALVGGWDLRTGRRLMVACNDRYTVDTEHDATRTTELLDRVRSLKQTRTGGRPSLLALCSNVAIPGLIIEKQYLLRPGRVLAKRVSFRTTDRTGFFLRYEAETNLDADFQKRSSRAGALGEAMTVSRGRMVTKTEQVVLENFSAGDAPMAISTDYAVGLATYRSHVNGRFVLQGPGRGTTTGWTNSVFVDYLQAGQPISGEVRWVVFSGDFTAFDRHYQALPEYRALWNYRRPEWTRRMVGDAMYLGPVETYPFLKACAPLLVTDTIWFLNPPWGNWGPDNDPPKSMHHNVYGIARDWRASFPNARVAAYTNMLFDDRSDIYREHPEFAVRDLEGQMVTSGISSDHQGRPTFYFQLNNPACRESVLNMHVAKFKAWDLDFFYMDGAGSSNEVVDWGYRDVVQSYDWLEFSRELRRRLQKVKPEAAWFVNGDRMPYSDIGYIEWRDEGWQTLAGPSWRPLALQLLRSKLNEPEGNVIVPTYGTPTADPALAAYVLMYGWCGHLSVVGRLPWMKEAFAYRGMRLVEEAVEPRWWRSNVEFEAYGFRHGDRAVVNVLDHATKPRTVALKVDTAKLGLRAGAPVSAELRLMNDTASELKPDPADPTKQVRVWRNTEAVTCRRLFGDRSCPKVLELSVPTRPVLVTTVVLTQRAMQEP